MKDHRRDSFVLSFTVGLIGVTFGVFAESSGFGLLKALLLSLLTFTGASQFAAVSVVGGGGSAFAAVASGLLLAARNSLYGPVVAPVLQIRRSRRALAAHFVIDETTAMLSAQKDSEVACDAFWFTGLWLFAFWNVGTVVGVLAGGLLEDPGVWGLDAAFPAAFVSLLMPHVRSRPGQVTAVLGAVITIVVVPFTPAGAPMLLAAMAVGPGLWIQRREESGSDSK